ncbi:hypothetical protein lacNasYZ03_16680 [Lactobacillus nasalidis]|uniref:Scaffolding protein n=1 Tax=Lactobacillus nasalidis TaxID=2797258 RepID=A0ABQ3W5Z3_9LACO|nr:hypothetical protein lacNasYZ01_14620 [Lactobacillus nasalidis]GHV99405.1 hypothetical protein lacNasYZ02_08350 [Lactobacillus nasalidis]GHW01981.1 hypothetical protein lacNasYZ03_16680 [Lactobacillus nasalidis]
MKAENEALKKQTVDYEASLKSFKKAAQDNEELTAQIEELQNQSKEQKDEFEATVYGLKLNSAVKDALTNAHVRNAKAGKGLLDMDKVDFDKDGNLPGLDDQLTATRESDGYLYDEGDKPNYDPANGQPAKADPVQCMVDVFKGVTDN